MNYIVYRLIIIFIIIFLIILILWKIIKYFKLPNLHYANKSDKGSRTTNQDCCGARIFRRYKHIHHCFVIADGLGGHRGGELASELAAIYLLENFYRITHDNLVPEITFLFREANDWILQTAKTNRRFTDMRTTCTMLLIIDNIAYWSHVGDSRLYFIRKGKIVHITKDHSVTQALLSMGNISTKDAKIHPQRNQLFKTLGAECELEPTIYTQGYRLRSGDCFLLCTDGFWEHLEDDDLLEMCQQSLSNYTNNHTKKQLAHLFLKVQKRAKTKVNYDNLTVQFIRVA